MSDIACQDSTLAPSPSLPAIMSDIDQGEPTLPLSPPQRMTLKQIRETLKDYFGDGYIIHSAPFRFNVHLCETQKVPVDNDNVFLSVNIDEETMPLFGSLGHTVKPALHTTWSARAPPIADAYKIFSGKNEASVEETWVYAMRHGLQWWMQWHDGTRKDYWKHLYVGWTAACDDILVPPERLVDGTFRSLGHTVSEMISGMLSDRGRSIHGDVSVARIDPKIRELLLEKTHVMSQFQIVNANVQGCAAAVLAARGIAFDGVRDEAVEMAALADCFSMNIAKEGFGLMKGEPTETTAGRDRGRLKAELRWMYARTMDQLDPHELAKYLKKFASSGLHAVLLIDRYHWPGTRGGKEAQDIDTACFLHGDQPPAATSPFLANFLPAKPVSDGQSQYGGKNRNGPRSSHEIAKNLRAAGSGPV
ncbi:hypothetical protein C8R45DRAFT_929283 [Mycena sanguinolenta]|nr:hypothetical protein C8R45DRAFT_929283 [Mycena sanguinolenta]